jgi:hypothetical protein
MFRPDQIEAIDHAAPPHSGAPSDSDGAASPLAADPLLRRRASIDAAAAAGQLGDGVYGSTPPQPPPGFAALGLGLGSPLAGGADDLAGSPGMAALGVSTAPAPDRTRSGGATPGALARASRSLLDAVLGTGGGAAAADVHHHHHHHLIDVGSGDSSLAAAAEEGRNGGALPGSTGLGSGGGGGPPGAGGGLRKAGKAPKKKAVPPVHVRNWLKIDEHGETQMVPAEKYKLTHKLGVQVGRPPGPGPGPGLRRRRIRAAWASGAARARVLVQRGEVREDACLAATQAGPPAAQPALRSLREAGACSRDGVGWAPRPHAGCWAHPLPLCRHALLLMPPQPTRGVLPPPPRAATSGSWTPP